MLGYLMILVLVWWLSLIAVFSWLKHKDKKYIERWAQRNEKD